MTGSPLRGLRAARGGALVLCLAAGARAEESPSMAPATAPLPDPGTTRQVPAPVPAAPREKPWNAVEVGADTGVISRPARDGGKGVSYAPSWALGGHARVEIAEWLGARIAARIEKSSASIDAGALGEGARFRDPSLSRIVLGAFAEPTWTPIPNLDLFSGVGVAWGRTVADPLRPEGGGAPTVASRAAVFAEFPLVLGVRYAPIPNWLVVNVSGSVSLLTGQSGHLLEEVRTPGADGKLVTLGGLPEIGTSWSVLAGVGVLL